MSELRIYGVAATAGQLVSSFAAKPQEATIGINK
jgi:hypothetical protein